jgi:hypothetical protein
MRRLAFVLLVSLSASAAEVPKGTHVLLKMMNSINTKTAAEGDQVYLQTENPIAADGKILVPAGSYVQGVVSHSKPSGKVKGRAGLAIRLDTLTLPDGRALKISPHLSSVDSNDTGQKVDREENMVKQGSDVGEDAKRIAIIAGSGASIGGIADRSWHGAGIGAGIGTGVGIGYALLTRGREVELKQGSTLDIVFDRAVTIE